MSEISRRSLVAGGAVLGSAAWAAGSDPGTAAAAREGRKCRPFGPVVVEPDDVRYDSVVRGTNQRFVGSPDYVRLVSTTEAVVAEVQRAVENGKRIAVRSGGHCYEDFVTAPEIEVVLDLSQMNAVYYDSSRSAFAVEAGADLGSVYDTLFKGWGVTVPGGACPSVGAGGHIVGGGYGALNRLFGLTVDHLAAVEVVVVDSRGSARAVVASRDSSDAAKRDLWWGHTGAGGGNFGVATRYWFRTSRAKGKPSQLLPRPPAEMLMCDMQWPWTGMTETGLARLLGNYGRWHERNSAPDSPYASLFCQLKPTPRVAKTIGMFTQIDGTLDDADALLDAFIAEVSAGVPVKPEVRERRRLPWLHSTLWPGFTGGGNITTRFKAKSAYLRKNFAPRQFPVFYKYLSSYENPGALVQMSSYGGKTNTVDPGDTAVAQRDSILKLHFINFWTSQDQDAASLSWMRRFYRDVFADTGGVPAPNDRTDGTFINYADVDVADPQWNSSDVPWHDLYYKSNYRRLRRIKAKWDPRNVFRHALSIRAR